MFLTVHGFLAHQARDPFLQFGFGDFVIEPADGTE